MQVPTETLAFWIKCLSVLDQKFSIFSSRSFASSRGWLTAESIRLEGRFIQFNYYYLILYSWESGCPMLQLQSLHGQQQLCWQLCWAHARWDNVPEFDCRYWQGQAQQTRQHFQLVVLVLMNKGLRDVATHIELYWQLSINDLVL